ncbi:MAG TPA: hypothetical protein VGM75_06130 [Pseudonocardiaceae bacterium]
MAAARRVSVTLDTSDQQAIEAFADSSRPEHSILEAWAEAHGINVRDASDSAILRTLIRAGAEALREKALEDGYARLAMSRHEDRAERRAIRDRGLERTDPGLAE